MAETASLHLKMAANEQMAANETTGAVSVGGENYFGSGGCRTTWTSIDGSTSLPTTRSTERNT